MCSTPHALPLISIYFYLSYAAYILVAVILSRRIRRGCYPYLVPYCFSLILLLFLSNISVSLSSSSSVSISFVCALSREGSTVLRSIVVVFIRS